MWGLGGNTSSQHPKVSFWIVLENEWKNLGAPKCGKLRVRQLVLGRLFPASYDQNICLCQTCTRHEA